MDLNINIKSQKSYYTNVYFSSSVSFMHKTEILT